MLFTSDSMAQTISPATMSIENYYDYTKNNDFAAYCDPVERFDLVDYKFTCQGEVCDAECTEFSACSYLRGGDILRFLRSTWKSNNTCDFKSTCSRQQLLPIRLFGIRFSSYSGAVRDLHTLFTLAVRNVAALRSAVDGVITNRIQLKPFQKHTVPTHKHQHHIAKSRQEVCAFLNFLKVYLSDRSTKTSELAPLQYIANASHAAPHLRPIVEQGIVLLLSHIGRVSDLPHNVVKVAGLSRNSLESLTSCLHHYFHLCLDVWWSSVVIVHLLEEEHLWNDLSTCITRPSCVEEHVKSVKPMSSQCMVRLLIEDLCELAVMRYCEFLTLESQFRLSMFPCTCVQEFWVLLVQLVEQKSCGAPIELFWVYMQDVFDFVTFLGQSNHIQNSSKVMKNSRILTRYCDFKVQNPTLFSLWLLKNLSLLYVYNEVGKPTDRCISSNYVQLEKLWDHVTKDECYDEIQLQWVMWYCIHITRRWEPNINFMLSMCDYFLKRMDESFFRPGGMSVNQLQVMYKSGLSWLEFTEDICTGEGSVPNKIHSSLHAFLYLIHRHIRKVVHEDSLANLWRKFQSRLYLKLHPRKLKDFTDRGIQNFFLFLLTLAHAGVLEQITKKAVEMSRAVEDQLAISKRLILCKAFFAFVHLGVHRNSVNAMELMFHHLCLCFENTVTELSKQSKTSEHYLNLVMLCDTYVAELREFMDHSVHFQDSLHAFFSLGFAQLLKNVSPSKASSLLMLVCDVLIRLISLKSDNGETAANHQRTVDNCYQHVLPFVMNSVSSGNTLPETTDVLVAFAKTQIHYPLNPNTMSGRNLLTMYFQMATEDQKMPAVLACRFLRLVLVERELLAMLEDKVQNLQTVLIRSWLRFAVCIRSCDDDLVMYTRIISELSDIQKLMTTRKFLCVDNPEDAVIEFFHAVGDKFRSAWSLQEKSALRLSITEYVEHFASCLDQSVRSCSSPEHLNQIYKLGACAVANCSQLLYTRRQPTCLLPSIIDALLFPFSLKNKERTILTELLPYIGKYLPQLVSGLIELGIKGDPYLERKTRNICSRYKDFPAVTVLTQFL